MFCATPWSPWCSISPVHPADGGRLPADGTVLLRSRHGPLLTDAIQRYDLNVVQTLVILYAVLGIVGVFLGDVLMMVVDPVLL